MPLQNEVDPYLGAGGAVGVLALLKIYGLKAASWLAAHLQRKDDQIDRERTRAEKERDLRISLLEERINELEKKVEDDGQIKQKLREELEEAVEAQHEAEKTAAEAQTIVEVLAQVNASLIRKVKLYEPDYEPIMISHQEG